MVMFGTDEKFWSEYTTAYLTAIVSLLMNQPDTKFNQKEVWIDTGN